MERENVEMDRSGRALENLALVISKDAQSARDLISKIRICGLAALLFAAANMVGADKPTQVIMDDAWQGRNGCVPSGRLTEVHAAPAADTRALGTFERNARLLLAGGEHGKVLWTVGGAEWTLCAGEGGYWSLVANQSVSLKPGWRLVETDPVSSSAAHFLVAAPQTTVGMISDIDDTILVTGVLYRGSLIRKSMATPADRRKVVPGMAAVFQKIAQGNPDPATTPIFYVSATPRQLTDNVREFLRVNEFPCGILELRQEEPPWFKSADDGYQLARIETIFEAFPRVRLQLFGDDGERDPGIYSEVVRRHPDRVIAVWIRHVNPDARRAIFTGQRDVAELLGPPGGEVTGGRTIKSRLPVLSGLARETTQRAAPPRTASRAGRR